MANAYLSRTPATASGQDRWTYSCWFKIGSLSSAFYIIGGNTNTGGSTRNELSVNIQPSGQFAVWAFNNSSGYYFNRFANNYFRDFSAWYHLVVQFDPDNGTSANRINAWINGVAVTWASTADSGAAGSIGSSSYRSVNNTYINVIGAGAQGGNPPVYFAAGYFAECNMVSGSLVAPTSFAYTDANGVWQPKAYTGVYGTNGFYLPMIFDTTGGTVLDNSGNGNNWTANNFPVTRRDKYQFTGLDISSLFNNAYGSGGSPAGGTATFTNPIPYNTLEIMYGNMANGSFGVITSGATLSVNGSTVAATSLAPSPPFDQRFAKSYFTNTPGTLTSVGISADVSGSYQSQLLAILVNGVVLQNPGIVQDLMNDGPTVNYCTLNPLPTQNYTYTNGNLSASSRSTGDASCIGTMGFTSGKWYFEGTITSNTYKGTIGILGTTTGSFADNVFTRIGSDQALGYDFRGYDGQRRNNSIASSYYGSALPDSATVGVAFDLDNNKIFVSVNGTWVASSEPVTGVNPMFTLTAGATYFPSLGDDWGTQTSSWDVNYGQQAFKYTAPTGFNPLSTASLPTPAVLQPSTQMGVNLWTDNGTNQAIPVGFTPNFTWIKCRTATPDNSLYNTVNGGNRLISNSSGIEDARKLAFSASGYTVDASTWEQSYAGNSYVGWSWKGGGTAVSNTSGSITSSVSANPTAGFSIVSWTGNGNNSDQTVGTGLSTPLDLIIPKARTANVGSNSWLVYSSAVPMGQNQCLILDSTSALISTADQGTVNRGATAGQIRLFAGSLSGLANQNFNGNNVQYVAYCFSAVAGYSASGSFTGNGSTAGPYIYTGFRPRFILTKCSSNSTSSTVWTIVDTTRDSYNPVLRELYPNSNSTEFTDSDGMDIYSNGFRPRRNSEYLNFNGWTYIYMAFAESPFKFSRAR